MYHFISHHWLYNLTDAVKTILKERRETIKMEICLTVQENLKPLFQMKTVLHNCSSIQQDVPSEYHYWRYGHENKNYLFIINIKRVSESISNGDRQNSADDVIYHFPVFKTILYFEHTRLDKPNMLSMALYIPYTLISLLQGYL